MTKQSEIIYQVRAGADRADPADRGRLLKECATYQEAAAYAASRAKDKDANDVFISKVTR